MLKSYFWLLHLLMIAAGAYFSADMANLMIGSRLEASMEIPRGIESVVGLQSIPSARGNRNYDGIIEGNIFNSKLRGKKADPERPAQSLPQVSPPQTPLAQTLVGTVVGEEDFYAVIEDTKTHEQLLYRIGDPIGDDGKIIQISRNKVVVRRGGEKEILEVSLFPEERKPTSQVMPTVAPPAAANNVRQAGKNRWMVDRREIENAVENLPQLLTKARIIPNFTEGKPDGFRIFAIAEESLYSKIGLQNGDILHRINGVEVKDPQNFLKVFEQLKDESAITVDLVRNNQKETFSYDIR